MYLWLKWIHILTATLLMGAGAGTAVSIVFALKEYKKTSNLQLLHYILKHAVNADWFFTASAGIVQLVTGIMLAMIAGLPLTEGWLFYSLILFIIIMLVWMLAAYYQIKMRNLASQYLVEEENALPSPFYFYFKMWMILGAIAFPLMLVVFYYMVFKY